MIVTGITNSIKIAICGSEVNNNHNGRFMALKIQYRVRRRIITLNFNNITWTDTMERRASVVIKAEYSTTQRFEQSNGQSIQCTKCTKLIFLIY